MRAAGDCFMVAQQRLRVCFLPSVLILLSAFAVGQKQTPPSGGGGSSTPSTPTRTAPTPTPTPTAPNRFPTDNNRGMPTTLFLSGRVILDQGVVPPESVVVEEVCGSTVRARTRTDLRGTFNLMLGKTGFTDTTMSASVADESLTNGRRDSDTRLIGCELRAVLAGYISSQLQLSDADSSIGMKDVGIISLKRLGGVQQGTTISVTSIQVPDKARKEYEKALKYVKQGEPDRAQEHLNKAVDQYPKYAAAWVTMGELHQQVNKLDEAKADFTRALDADPNYVPPLIHLAYLAARENKWNDVLTLSAQAMRLDPLSFADVHYLNGAANFNLNRLPEAKRATLKAAEIDEQNRIPRIHYLLAAIYELSGERQLAATQYREFLKLVPDSPDSKLAKQHLARIGDELRNGEQGITE